MKTSHFLSVIAMTGLANARPRALVHKGEDDCKDCPESLGDLLESSPYEFEVHYAGHGQEYQVNSTTLSMFDVYASGGGQDVGTGWKDVKAYKADIRDYVANGGIYFGVCLGAYYAGKNYFDLLPGGGNVSSEINRDNTEVDDSNDTVIKVDWTFANGTTAANKWMYFQEGAVMTSVDDQYVVATYSSNQDIAASLTPFDGGWVALIGTHPEADYSWYTDDGKHITNPDGYERDLGNDFIQQFMSKKTQNSWLTVLLATLTSLLRLL